MAAQAGGGADVASVHVASIFGSRECASCHQPWHSAGADSMVTHPCGWRLHACVSRTALPKARPCRTSGEGIYVCRALPVWFSGHGDSARFGPATDRIRTSTTRLKNQRKAARVPLPRTSGVPSTPRVGAGRSKALSMCQVPRLSASGRHYPRAPCLIALAITSVRSSHHPSEAPCPSFEPRHPTPETPPCRRAAPA